MMHLKLLYPSDHEFTDQELRAWRKMMKSVGCMNITPYKKQELKVIFFKLNGFIFFRLFVQKSLTGIENRSHIISQIARSLWRTPVTEYFSDFAIKADHFRKKMKVINVEPNKKKRGGKKKVKKLRPPRQEYIVENYFAQEI